MPRSASSRRHSCPFRPRLESHHPVLSPRDDTPYPIAPSREVWTAWPPGPRFRGLVPDPLVRAPRPLWLGPYPGRMRRRSQRPSPSLAEDRAGPTRRPRCRACMTPGHRCSTWRPSPPPPRPTSGLPRLCPDAQREHLLWPMRMFDPVDRDSERAARPLPQTSRPYPAPSQDSSPPKT